MFVYFSVTTKATTTQSRIVPVTCEKCGCSFFYEMTRMGEGANVAHYGIDLSFASAERKAESDARKRLTNDVELVPCPSCRWINDELICRDRKANFREWTVIALLVVSVGIVASLIWTSRIYLGSAENRGTIPYFILPGILGGVIAGAILFLQNWFRNRIQPNQHYPEEPRLPWGTPPALLLNQDGDLVLARPDATQTDLEDDSCSMVFQIGKHEYDTDLCCVCLQRADPASSGLCKPSEKSSLPIPLCAACARKQMISKWARSLGIALIVFVLATSLAFAAGAVISLRYAIVSGSSLSLSTIRISKFG